MSERVERARAFATTAYEAGALCEEANHVTIHILCEHDLAAFAAAEVARALEIAAWDTERLYPKGSAHTYASENADRYRAQEETCAEIAKRLRARASMEAKGYE